MSLLGPACGWANGWILSASRMASNILLLKRPQFSLVSSAFRFVLAMRETASDSLKSSGKVVAGVDGGSGATSVHSDQELCVSVGVVRITVAASGEWDQDRVLT